MSRLAPELAERLPATIEASIDTAHALIRSEYRRAGDDLEQRLDVGDWAGFLMQVDYWCAALRVTLGADTQRDLRALAQTQPIFCVAVVTVDQTPRL
ncbi:hypothetical protein NOMA109596_01040 [Nocardioides marinus]|uniref:Uncharacterized protein n=1 Tax=Nocardioides marinus TaxID=374514 RepID=A0A7Z0C307_9ACTN|nr:hypothetical protein [Nocardioides marinus]NYI08561.1 hypothetical protein [Nocardioides marinus]